MSEKLYDVLKYINRIFLPAALTLYSVIAAVLAIPKTEEILIIGSAFNAFLGTCLEESSRNYKEENNDE